MVGISALKGRSPRTYDRMTRWGFWAVLALAAAAPWFTGSAYGQVLLNMAGIYAILTLGFYVIFGLTGIFSVAQAAFWGIGAYTSALLSTDAGLPVWIGIAAAPLVAASAGVLLGLPTLKLKSHYLTMATIGFAEVVRQLMINWEWLTHGPTGIRAIPAPSLGPLSLEPYRAYYYLTLACVALVAAGVLRLRASRLGRGMRTILDDEVAAEATGVDVTGLKILAFALSAFCAGLAGALYAHLQRYVSPDAFHLEVTIQVLAMLLIGGRRSVAGAIVGAVLLTYLPEALRGLKDWYMAIYGGGLLLILVALPEGLAGFAARALARLRGRQDRGAPAAEGGRPA